MTEHLLKRAAVISLAEGRPLHLELERLSPGRFQHACALSESGKLQEALKSLSFKNDEARACAAWPAAAVRCHQALKQLPGLVSLYGPLITVLAFFLVISTTLAVVNAILMEKVFPIFQLMHSGYGVAYESNPLLQTSLFPGLLLVPLVLVGIFWALNRIGVWKAWHVRLGRARKMLLSAALVEKGAPSEILQKWLPAELLSSNAHSSQGTLHRDLMQMALSDRDRALETMARFVAVTRITGLMWYVMMALMPIFEVYLKLYDISGLVR